MPVALYCLSHSPLMNRVSLDPKVKTAVDAVIGDIRDQVAAFAPDLIVFFGPDHFNCFFYTIMPAFCVGNSVTAIGDYGTIPGPLPVPDGLAAACVEAVAAADVDLALSYKMTVDHGVTQTLEQVTGGIDRFPILPVFVNSIAAPIAPVRRARLLGQAIGAFLGRHAAGQKILILGSGGLSHDPPIPSLTTGSPAIRAQLIDGKPRSPAEQSEHEQRVEAAAHAFAAVDPVIGGGALLAINPDWDRKIMHWLATADWAQLDALDNETIASQGGKGGHEIRAWIAAFACLSSFGAYTAETLFYQPIAEWITGFGMVAAQPNRQDSETHG